MNWLLLFVPVTVALEYLAPERHLLVFVTSGLAILPLAGWMGRATEQLAERMGEGVGGLLNATFGNAAELIIALAALRAGLHDVVKASIAGSIVGNILLVLGAAMLAGGLRHREQHFNAAGARAPGDDADAGGDRADPARRLSGRARGSAAAGVGHAQRLDLDRAAPRLRAVPRLHAWSPIPRCSSGSMHRRRGRSARPPGPRSRRGVLAAATAVIAWMSEILVGAIEPTAHESLVSAASSSAFSSWRSWAMRPSTRRRSRAALKNRMDLSLSIAIGSSVQVALFVAPVLVLASLFLGPAPMDLAFPAGLVLIVLLSVLITGQVAGDGRSDWLKGVQLLAVYLVLGLTFFFVPDVVPR